MRRNKMAAAVMCAVMAAAAVIPAGAAQQETEAVSEQQETEAAGGQQETEAAGGQETAEVGNVVASSVAIVEILDAMQVPMVGVPTSSYELPESVADATEIGNPMSPDMEVVTSLEPDYIISVNSLEADLDAQFQATGAQTYYADLSSYESLITTITDLGELFGTQEAAQTLVADLEAKVTEAEAKAEGKESPTVLIIFGAGSSFMVASEDTYVGDLVRLAGGVNVVTDAPSAFSPIDMEYLAAQNPDYILLMAHANPEESMAALQEEFETNESWQNFDAVTEGRVYSLETGYFGMSANLEAGEALEKLVDLLYQEEEE